MSTPTSGAAWAGAAAIPRTAATAARDRSARGVINKTNVRPCPELAASGARRPGSGSPGRPRSLLHRELADGRGARRALVVGRDHGDRVLALLQGLLELERPGRRALRGERRGRSGAALGVLERAVGLQRGAAALGAELHDADG